MGNNMSFSGCLEAIFSSRCWDFLANRAAAVLELEEKRDDLETALSNLKAQRDALEQDPSSAETQYKQRRADVASWLSDVTAKGRQVDGLIAMVDRELENNCCFGWLPKNLISRSRLVERVNVGLRRVRELEARGRELVAGGNLVYEAQFPTSVEMDSEQLVGVASTFEDIMKHLQDENVGTIGLHGPGGVGKTALLIQVHNNFRSTEDFEAVLWSEVPRDLTMLGNVQSDIGKGIGYRGDEWEAKKEEEKADDIRNVLSKIRFLLLLDNLWKPFDKKYLSKIGVPPPPKNGSKLVFTTRQEEICGALEARWIEVKILPPDMAFNLFDQKVGADNPFKNDDPNYPTLARAIEEKCGGLPLALITLGRAMSSKKLYEDWQRAPTDLRESTLRLSGMEEVFMRLKYSLDSLPKNTEKECLLYCSLFPQSLSIPKDDIIHYWIGEGLLGAESDDATDDPPMDCGHRIIQKLSDAHLLKTMEREVKMHDLFWEMALWVSKGCEARNRNVLMKGGRGLMEAPNSSEWSTAEKISLMQNEIENLPEETLECTHLSTLLLNSNKLKVIPNGFFQHMPSLKVLDISHNPDLVMLPPEIGDLSSLRYLNLSNIGIMTLPTQLKNLTRLEYLNLKHTKKLEVIPLKLVATFEMLQVFKSSTSYSDGVHPASTHLQEHESLMEDLNSLKYLSYLDIGLKTKVDVQRFQKSERLLSCINELSFVEIKSQKSIDITILKAMTHIKRVEFRDCKDLESIDYPQEFSLRRQVDSQSFVFLREVLIVSCRKLKNLTCLLCFALNIQALHVITCSMLEELIGLDDTQAESETQKPLSRVEILRLAGLVRLKSIYPGTLPFPCLKHIILFCPKLKKLPLNSTSASSGRGLLINGLQQWWNNLEWEDAATKRIFSECFREPLNVRQIKSVLDREITRYGESSDGNREENP